MTELPEAMAISVVASADFNDLCRLCAAKTSVLMGLHIFEREGDVRQILKKITNCLPIQVAVTDRLPKMVCEECVYKLDLLSDFREKSLKTESLLCDMLVASQVVTAPEDPTPLVNNALPDMYPLPIVAESITSITPPAPVENNTAKVEMETVSVETTSSQPKVKSEPEVLIKVEDSLMDGAGGAGSDSESDSDSDSESDSDGDGFHEEEGVESSTNQPGIQSDVTVTEAVAPTVGSGDHFMNPAANGLLMLSCPQQTGDNQDQASWYFCNVCGKTFAKSEDFQTHYEGHCNKCGSCGALFTNDDALKAHRKEMHPRKNGSKVNNKTTVVTTAGAVVQGAGEELKEELEATEKPASAPTSRRKKWEPKVCPECGKQYRTNYKLTEHMRKHTGEKPFKCSTCPKAFRSKIGLAQHEAKHTGQYDYTCNSCGKGFQCKSYLIVHQRVHSDVKPFPCTTCGRHFKTKQSLLDHQNRHLGVKPYLCETCGRRFITKGLCKSHQRVHSGGDNKQFPCSVCGKMFVSKSYLATHLRIHTGEKPFMCEVCGKGFLTRVDLRIHSTMHTGEKSFVCEWCGKAFARRDALRCHRRSHTGERPYRCDVCGQSFTQFSPLTIHKRLHTGERPYPCDICGKAFVSRSTMMSHRKKHHHN